MSSERDIHFLAETLRLDLFPDGSDAKSADFRRLVKQDLVRKRAAQDNQNFAEPVEFGMTSEKTSAEPVSVSQIGGRFIVIAAAQELRPVLHAAKSIGMEYEETSFGRNLVGHHLTWQHGGGTTDLWLVVSIQQGVDAVSALITRLCERFSPASVILTGMMGGVPKKIKFLDVVVPTVIYDGRIVGTKDKEILAEPEPARVHPSLHAIANNIPNFEIDGLEIGVKKNKKSLTVAAKHDDISQELFQKIVGADEENIVAFEMEGQAIAYSNLFQQLDGENVIFGMVKGVADFGGMDCGQTEAEMDEVKDRIGYIDSDGDFDPIENPIVKKKLQFEATKRALVVAAEISRRIEVISNS